MTRMLARLTFLVMLVVPAVAVARQTFKPEQALQYVNFTAQPSPQLSITTEPGDLPIKLHHVSGLGPETVDARARDIKLTYTKTGLTVDLTDGTLSSTRGPWRSEPQSFKTVQLEFGTNGEMIWTKVK